MENQIISVKVLITQKYFTFSTSIKFKMYGAVNDD